MDIRKHKRLALAYIAAMAMCTSCLASPQLAPLGGNAEQLADHDADGLNTASRLQARYDDHRADCGGPTRPAFLCSGVLLRGTAYSTAFASWNPNLNSPKPAGVSFSFLRQDSTFERLAYGYSHGFVVYPVFDHPVGKPGLEVLCAFPIDAATDLRSSAGGAIRTKGNTGCGATAVSPHDSKPCEAYDPERGVAKIDTPSAWYQYYRYGAAPKNTDATLSHSRECGYTMVTGTPNSAARFQDFLTDMKLLNTSPPSRMFPANESFETQNELIISAWPQNDSVHLPLEAFIYVATQASGPKDTRSDQRDFEKSGGGWRPIIRMTLPTTPGGTATFAYSAADQGVP